MNDEKGTHNTQIIIAIIGVVGILGGAVIANWDKIFPPPVTDNSSVSDRLELPSDPISEPATRIVEPLSTEQALTRAEEMTAKWLTAWAERDIDGLMALTGTPFYFDQSVLISTTEIRAKYAAALQEKATDSIKLDGIKASEVGELKLKGMLNDRDRILSNLRINDNDVAVIVMASGEGVIYFFRRVEGTLKMVGFWD
jgi:hypothetical protein